MKKSLYTHSDIFHHYAVTARKNNLDFLLPCTPKERICTHKPTQGNGGRVVQPGGGFAGN